LRLGYIVHPIASEDAPQTRQAARQGPQCTNITAATAPNTNARLLFPPNSDAAALSVEAGGEAVSVPSEPASDEVGPPVVTVVSVIESVGELMVLLRVIIEPVPVLDIAVMVVLPGRTMRVVLAAAIVVMELFT